MANQKPKGNIQDQSYYLQADGAPLSQLILTKLTVERQCKAVDLMIIASMRYSKDDADKSFVNYWITT